MTITTPTSPTITDNQRRTPTFSPKMGTDKAVINSGATKKIAVASASGNTATPTKNDMLATTTHSPRNTCSFQRVVRRLWYPPSNGMKSPRTITNAITARMKTIWCSG